MDERSTDEINDQQSIPSKPPTQDVIDDTTLRNDFSPSRLQAIMALCRILWLKHAFYVDEILHDPEALPEEFVVQEALMVPAVPILFREALQSESKAREAFIMHEKMNGNRKGWKEGKFETHIDMTFYDTSAYLVSPMIVRPSSDDPKAPSTDFFYLLVVGNAALTGQAAFTLISLSTSSPTLDCVGAFTVVGFIGSLSAILLRYRLPKVARYLGKVSTVIGAAAVVAAYTARFHPVITWARGLVCGVALLIPSVAVLFA